MLAYLKVRDFALVDLAEIEFESGFNVLTGETGAGKTVLVEAIGLLLGDRAEGMMARKGTGAAVLEAAFDLSGSPGVAGELVGLGFLDEGEDELALARTIPASGKGRCTVNGRLSTVSALQSVGEVLVDVHGQNTHQALLKPSTHMDYLDRFAGSVHLELLGGYRERYLEYRRLIDERERLAGAGPGSMREADLLRHEVGQIEVAGVREGELEDLELEAGRLRNARLIGELSASAASALSGDGGLGAGELLTRAADDLGRIAEKDPPVEGLRSRAEALAIEAEDLARELTSYRGLLEADPSRLEEIESRLSALRELFRRYGGSAETTLAYLHEASERLREIEGGELRLAEIDGEIASATRDMEEKATGLDEARREAASRLEEAVAAELEQLELGHAALEVNVAGAGGKPGEAKPGPDGFNTVEFMFRPAPDEEFRPLRKIASGGEMSRVMLALKIVLAGADRLPILVFDEVDSGIGGETALAVGEKLHRLGVYHQVFCITHLPQIATFADHQYRVFKHEGARTDVEPLDEDGRLDELCRMLGDSSGRKVTREHARASLERARERMKQV
ncbi:MAG: DNA repair protein RecN [Actinomycetota bacterium]